VGKIEGFVEGVADGDLVGILDGTAEFYLVLLSLER
jgi:hypothetical protein